MSRSDKNSDKALYAQLRRLTVAQLQQEIARFDLSIAEERVRNVALIRAVGVVFSESGSLEQRQKVRKWLLSLLRDPVEKIRRYAINALPKIGGGEVEEAELLKLVEANPSDREKTYLGKALSKIGGKATLKTMETTDFLPRIEQKLQSAVVRSDGQSGIKFDSLLQGVSGVRLNLHGRRGLESIVREEAEAYTRRHGKLRVVSMRPGLVAMTSLAPFTLGDAFSLRCFGTLGLVAGVSRNSSLNTLAEIITSPLTRLIFEKFTEGAVRYRLDFVSKGHQRAAVRELAELVYAKCPSILNDPHDAPWTVAIDQVGHESVVELIPKVDPRFYYRQQDVPAASHPPLAACMARLAGKHDHDEVWDPFCGSGLELVERGLLGGVSKVYGTDLDPRALDIAKRNFAAAQLHVPSEFLPCDFREFASSGREVSLIITNPPLGKRVPIDDLNGLIHDLLQTAVKILIPGGRLVFVNPVRLAAPSGLRLDWRRRVDLGGFDCHLERYRRI